MVGYSLVVVMSDTRDVRTIPRICAPDCFPPRMEEPKHMVRLTLDNIRIKRAPLRMPLRECFNVNIYHRDTFLASHLLMVEISWTVVG